MALRPRAIIRPPAIRRIMTARSHLRLGCCRISLEEPGIVIHRGLEFLVAIVKPEQGFALGLEIQTPLNRKQLARDRQGWIVPVVHRDHQLARTAVFDRHIHFFRDDRGTGAIHPHARNFARSIVMVARV